MYALLRRSRCDEEGIWFLEMDPEGRRVPDAYGLHRGTAYQCGGQYGVLDFHDEGGGDHLSIQDKKSYILRELKKRGCRITNQRKILIDIILKDECCSCKEINYQAIKEDPSIGMATVYRMVRTLEEIGLIQRKNMYRIDVESATA